MKFHVMDRDLSRYPFPYGVLKTFDSEEEAEMEVESQNRFYTEDRFYICREN